MPTTVAGSWKRRRADELQEITGKAFCTSCQSIVPKDSVVRRRTRGGTVRPICTTCLALRAAHMNGGMP